MVIKEKVYLLLPNQHKQNTVLYKVKTCKFQ